MHASASSGVALGAWFSGWGHGTVSPVALQHAPTPARWTGADVGWIGLTIMAGIRSWEVANLSSMFGFCPVASCSCSCRVQLQGGACRVLTLVECRSIILLESNLGFTQLRDLMQQAEASKQQVQHAHHAMRQELLTSIR